MLKYIIKNSVMKKLVKEYLNERYDITSKNTNIPEKISEEQKTYNIINNILVSPSWPNNKWIGLIGKPDEQNFERHVKMCENLNIFRNKMIIVERDENIYDELYKRNKIGYPPCTVLQGDFKDILEKHLKKLDGFALVDFDATSPLSGYEIELVDILQKYSRQIEILRIVTSSRGRSRDMEIISKNLNLPEYYKPIYMNNIIKDTILSQCKIPEIIQEINKDKQSHQILQMYALSPPPENIIFSEYCASKNLYCIFENYKGVSTMSNFIISKNKKLLDYADKFNSINVISQNIYGNHIKIMKSGKLPRYINYYNIGNDIYRKNFGLIAHMDSDTISQSKKRKNQIQSSIQLTAVVKELINHNDIVNLEKILNKQEYSINIEYLISVFMDDKISIDIKNILGKKYNREILRYLVHEISDDNTYESMHNKISPYLPKYY